MFYLVDRLFVENKYEFYVLQKKTQKNIAQIKNLLYLCGENVKDAKSKDLYRVVAAAFDMSRGMSAVG